MVLVKSNVQSVQDMPPPGGYPKINATRGARHRGPRGWVIWSTVIGLTVFGFTRIAKTNEESRNWGKERRETRMAVAPFIQAEMDRRMQLKYDKELELEAEIMKNRKDWVVGKPQYSQRWHYPVAFIRNLEDDEKW